MIKLLNILVCIKQVPGTSQVEVDPVTGVLRRDGVASKLNPYDLYALETAIVLCEQYGGSVKTVTMGPMQAKAAILETVYMGAQGGLLVSDRKFAGADVLATSYTLSQAVNSMGRFDLLLCGKQTTDGDTAQVGAEMAEFLGIPHANNVLSVRDVGHDSVTVTVNLERQIATQNMPMPCVLCMDGDINTPRLPSYKRKKEMTGNPVAVISIADFEDRNERHYGLSGSPTQVERIFPPKKNDRKEMLRGSNKEKADALAEILRREKFI